MHKDLIAFNMAQRSKKEIPNLHSGDVVKVYRRIIEGGKERTQMFQGMVIAMRGGQSSSPTVTIRKISFGIGVELVLPLYSEAIEKIEVVKSTRSRRSKLYYVREKSAKLLRRKLKEVGIKTGKGLKPVDEALLADMSSPAEETTEEEIVPEVESAVESETIDQETGK
ncbi:MAG: 50S ribosomal protein L19 [Candidatus Moraniibacteriota bacterium]